MPSQAQGRDGAGVDDEEVLELPRVRHVLVAREHEVHAGALQALDRVARVVDDVALAARAGDRQQMVMQHEDAQLGRLGGELLLDPAVAATADLPVIEVGLRRVDGHHGHAALAEHRVAVAEQLLEMDVADVPRIVVPRDHHERLALDPVEVAAGLRVLLLEPERRQIARADDDVGFQVVDLGNRPFHQVRHEVRSIRNGGPRDERSSTAPRQDLDSRASEARCYPGHSGAGNTCFPGILRLRAAAF